MSSTLTVERCREALNGQFRHATRNLQYRLHDGSMLYGYDSVIGRPARNRYRQLSDKSRLKVV
ncbi:hypothetical protein [Cupriavidus necator]